SMSLVPSRQNAIVGRGRRDATGKPRKKRPRTGRAARAENPRYPVASRRAGRYTPYHRHLRRRVGHTVGRREGVRRFHTREAAMKTLVTLVLAVVMLFALTAGVRADDVTLKGTITCAKCDLKKEKECMTVIKVKEGDKDVIYYFDVKDEEAKKKYHKEICQTP